MIKMLMCTCVLLLGCSQTCRIPETISVTSSPFFQQQQNWNYYIERINSILEETSAEYTSAQKFIAEIAQVDELLDVTIQEKLASIELSLAQQKQVTTIWKSVLTLREKFLYSSAVTADLRNQWQENIRDCYLENHHIGEQLNKLPSILSYEKKMKICDAIYNACLQLSLRNIEIINPYVEE